MKKMPLTHGAHRIPAWARHLPPPPLPEGANPADPPPIPFVTDALSGILDDLEIHSMVAGLSRYTAPWGVALPQGPSCFYVVRSGRMILQISGRESVWLQEGDLAVLVHSSEHQIKDHPQSTAVPIHRLLTMDHLRHRRGIEHGGGGPMTTLIFGAMIYDTRRSPLLRTLPNLIVVKAKNHCVSTGLLATLEMIDQENQAVQPGFQSVINQLAKIIFIQAVRAFVADSPAGSAPLIAALRDHHIGRALSVLHHQYSDSWTVASLAQVVGMSRSIFAERFSRIIGQSPMAYLQHCRMQMACRLLSQQGLALKAIAQQVGYGSESAFSIAFKRWTGLSPGQYRLQL
jgi:AraC-like DNA-binding protein